MFLELSAVTLSNRNTAIQRHSTLHVFALTNKHTDTKCSFHVIHERSECLLWSRLGEHKVGTVTIWVVVCHVSFSSSVYLRQALQFREKTESQVAHTVLSLSYYKTHVQTQPHKCQTQRYSTSLLFILCESVGKDLTGHQ